MAGELTYRRLLSWLKICEADESDMLDCKVQIKIDETDALNHIAIIMIGQVAEEGIHQPYILTCADSQRLDNEKTIALQNIDPFDDWSCTSHGEQKDDWCVKEGRPAYMRDEDWD